VGREVPAAPVPGLVNVPYAGKQKPPKGSILSGASSNPGALFRTSDRVPVSGGVRRSAFEVKPGADVPAGEEAEHA
jgi:hypothetical protein